MAAEITASRLQARMAPRASRLGAIAGLGGVLAFVVAAFALHGVRGDLDWWSTPLSVYLLGSPGHWLQAGYVALAVGIAGLAIATYRGADRVARSAAPLLLFAVAAIALVVTALAPTDLPGDDASVAGLVHNTAAGTTFLCVTTAILLQSWRWRGEARVHVGSALALAAFVALWVHALCRGAPRGLSQRVVVALVLSWLAWASLRLLRRA